jgi:hypothetical protein
LRRGEAFEPESSSSGRNGQRIGQHKIRKQPQTTGRLDAADDELYGLKRGDELPEFLSREGA